MGQICGETRALPDAAGQELDDSYYSGETLCSDSKGSFTHPWPLVNEKLRRNLEGKLLREGGGPGACALPSWKAAGKCLAGKLLTGQTQSTQDRTQDVRAQEATYIMLKNVSSHIFNIFLPFVLLMLIRFSKEYRIIMISSSYFQNFSSIYFKRTSLCTCSTEICWHTIRLKPNLEAFKPNL